MPYTVYSSEKLRKSGADAETKAMLYLMNFREDSSEMNYFIVDFFNGSILHSFYPFFFLIILYYHTIICQ